MGGVRCQGLLLLKGGGGGRGKSWRREIDKERREVKFAKRGRLERVKIAV